MRRMARVAGLVVALTLAGEASAQFQNIARDHLRLQNEQRECRERFAAALERPRNGCTGPCLTRQEQLRDRCLARAQTRYDRAVRRAMRARY